MTDINSAAFDVQFRENVASFQSLLGTFRNSPTLVDMINTFGATNPGGIRLGVAGGGTFTSTDGKVITIDPNWLPNSGAATSQSALVFSTIIGHELGHATQKGGRIDQQWDNISDLSLAAQIGNSTEGVALEKEYLVGREERDALSPGSPVVMYSGIGNNLVSILSSATDIKRAASDWNRDQNPSNAPNLSYDEYYRDLFMLVEIGASDLIDLRQVAHGSFTVQNNSDGSWQFQSASLPTIDGSAPIIVTGIFSPLQGHPGQVQFAGAAYNANTNKEMFRVTRASIPGGSVTTRTNYNAQGHPIGSPEVTFVRNGELIDVGKLGALFGSQLGQMIAGSNVLAQIGVTTLGATLGGAVFKFGEDISDSLLGRALPGQPAGDSVIDYAFKNEFGHLSSDIAKKIGPQTQQALSTLVLSDLAESLGLNGFAGKAFTSAGVSISTQVLDNISKPGFDYTIRALTDGIKAADIVASIATLGGGKIGSQIGSDLVTPDSVGASLFASVASAYGAVELGAVGASFAGVGEALAAGSSEAILASEISSALAAVGVDVAGVSLGSVFGISLSSIILPGIGAFIGALLGQTVGAEVFKFVDNLTGHVLSDIFTAILGQPDTPNYQDNVSLEVSNNKFVVTAYYGYVPSKENGKFTDADHQAVDATSGMRSAVDSMTGAYLSTVNSLVAMIGGRIAAPPVLDAPNSSPSYEELFGENRDHIQPFNSYIGDGTTALLSLPRFVIHGKIVYLDLGDGSHVDLATVNGDAGKLVRIATEYTLRHISVLGGDMVKNMAFVAWQRQTAGTPITGDSLTILNSNLQVASDYSAYLKDTASINLLIASLPDSALAVGWVATLLQAEALGLNRDYVIGHGLVHDSMATQGNDALFTADGGDSVVADAGNDTVTTYGGNDSVDGGDGDDQILGGAGDDTIFGGAGADTLTGGEGADTFVVGREANVTDIITDFEFWNPAEKIDLTAFTSGFDNFQELKSHLVQIGDSAVLELGANQRLVIHTVDRSSIRYSNFVGYAEQGVFASGSGNDLLTAGIDGNVLDAGAGNDTIIAGGGGSDTITAGAGDDRFVIDKMASANDVVMDFEFWNPEEKIDLAAFGAVFASFEDLEPHIVQIGDSAVLELGDNQRVVLHGLNAGRIYPSSFVGMTASHVEAGGDGNDLLTGSAGGDTLIGGGGDDIYRVDNTGDAVIEGVGEGADSVASAIGYCLPSNVENLTLTGSATWGWGNELANSITGDDMGDKLRGGSGDDTLFGGDGADSLYGGNDKDSLVGGPGNDTLDGAAGADTMAGGSGDDTYYVDNPSDVVTENPGEGVDRVVSSLAFFWLGDNAEVLKLAGSGNFIGWGNSGDNVLVGNSGNNQFRGGAGNDTLDGGAGADTLHGGVGADKFVFHVGQANGDMVDDFLPGVDAIEFSGFGTGATFAPVNATDWQVSAPGGGSPELIHFTNSPAIAPSDYRFV